MHPFEHSFFRLFLIIVAVCIAIAVLYVLTLRKALSRCAPQNRAAEPDTAWLLLIPIFNLFWQFIFYPRISQSLEREFHQRGLPIEANPAKSLGLALAILHACSIIPVLNILTGFAALVCSILYWIKISGYSSQLATSAAVPGFSATTFSSSPQASWNPPSPPAEPSSPWPSPAQSQTPPQSSPQAHGLFCTNCGNPLHPGELLCPTCGKPVS